MVKLRIKVLILQKLMALTNQWIYYCLSVLMVHLMIVCHTWIIKTKPNAKIKAIKGNAEQSRSAFAFSKKQMMKQFKIQ